MFKIEERKLFGKNTQIEKVIDVKDINKAKVRIN